MGDASFEIMLILKRGVERSISNMRTGSRRKRCCLGLSFLLREKSLSHIKPLSIRAFATLEAVILQTPVRSHTEVREGALSEIYAIISLSRSSDLIFNVIFLKLRIIYHRELENFLYIIRHLSRFVNNMKKM